MTEAARVLVIIGGLMMSGCGLGVVYFGARLVWIAFTAPPFIPPS